MLTGKFSIALMFKDEFNGQVPLGLMKDVLNRIRSRVSGGDTCWETNNDHPEDLYGTNVTC